MSSLNVRPSRKCRLSLFNLSSYERFFILRVIFDIFCCILSKGFRFICNKVIRNAQENHGLGLLAITSWEKVILFVSFLMNMHWCLGLELLLTETLSNFRAENIIISVLLTIIINTVNHSTKLKFFTLTNTKLHLPVYWPIMQFVNIILQSLEVLHSPFYQCYCPLQICKD